MSLQHMYMILEKKFVWEILKRIYYLSYLRSWYLHCLTIYGLQMAKKTQIGMETTTAFSLIFAQIGISGIEDWEIFRNITRRRKAVF